jgi:hypothetical protein
VARRQLPVERATWTLRTVDIDSVAVPTCKGAQRPFFAFIEESAMAGGLIFAVMEDGFG